MRTRAITERFCGGDSDSLRRAAISSGTVPLPFRDIRACGIKKMKRIQRLIKVKSSAWKKVAEEMDSYGKYTVLPSLF